MANANIFVGSCEKLSKVACMLKLFRYVLIIIGAKCEKYA